MLGDDSEPYGSEELSVRTMSEAVPELPGEKQTRKGNRGNLTEGSMK